MSREIRFRIWDKINKTMSYENTEFDKPFVITLQGRVISADDYCASCEDFHYWNEWKENDGILMQFTGLEDKNKQEIYEGDIIKVTRLGDYSEGGKTFTTIIEWRFNGWHYFHNKLDFALNSGQHIEVIGNIYENPELLENG